LVGLCVHVFVRSWHSLLLVRVFVWSLWYHRSFICLFNYLLIRLLSDNIRWLVCPFGLLFVNSFILSLICLFVYTLILLPVSTSIGTFLFITVTETGEQTGAGRLVGWLASTLNGLLRRKDRRACKSICSFIILFAVWLYSKNVKIIRPFWIEK